MMSTRAPAATATPRLQVALVDAVAAFLQRAAPGQLELSRPLAEWLMGRACSRQAAVRAAVLRRAALLAEPQVILTLCHEGAHPIHTRDREAVVEGYEAQVRRHVGSFCLPARPPAGLLVLALWLAAEDGQLLNAHSLKFRKAKVKVEEARSEGQEASSREQQ